MPWMSKGGQGWRFEEEIIQEGFASQGGWKAVKFGKLEECGICEDLGMKIWWQRSEEENLVERSLEVVEAWEAG